MTLLDGEGYLWVMGGEKDGYRYEDIWKSTWSFNNVAETAARCKLTIPDCGVGLKCWPSDKGTMMATDRSGVYCNACPYNYGSTSTAASSTTVVAFLVVFIIAFLIALLLLGYTYYKLREGGAASPIPLPGMAQRWWNKSTTGGAIGSTDPSSTANGDGLYQPLRIRDQV